ncbi:MAG: DUF47 family protein, partial [Thermoplasmata archaeon]
MEKSSFFKKFTSVAERKLLANFTGFPDLGKEVADFLIEMMQSDPREMDVLNERVKMKEKEGDDLSENFSVMITRGAINPSLIDNLLFLVNRMDDIIDRSYYLSREIKRM